MLFAIFLVAAVVGGGFYYADAIEKETIRYEAGVETCIKAGGEPLLCGKGDE